MIPDQSLVKLSNILSVELTDTHIMPVIRWGTYVISMSNYYVNYHTCNVYGGLDLLLLIVDHLVNFL